jgi:hypothetical protein
MPEPNAEIASRLRTALAANPECRPGLLARDRVVYAERGCLSHRNDRELFCLVRHVSSPFVGFFYGHVLRVRVKPEAEPEFPGGAWAALLVDCGVAIDGATPGEVLANAREWLWEMGHYDPGIYAQHVDDVFKLCGSFDEACDALAEMIRRFELKCRALVLETEEDEQRYGRGEFPRPGKLDMRSMDIYGLGQLQESRRLLEGKKDHWSCRDQRHGAAESPQPQGVFP